MLLLGSNKTITVDGVTVLPDHADANQFWYLPSEVTLARRSQDDRASFTFIMFKPAAVAAGVKGGGFLTFEVNIRLGPETEQKILSRLSAFARNPKLTAVPFDEGTVQCVALDLQGAGGTTADPAPPGTFRAVEKILGASIPSLVGYNSAAFSLSLDQEGAIILEKAFKDGTTPVGVIYNLKFTGLRPALEVKITADFKRIYNSFSASLSGQYYFLKATLDAAFDKLKQEGAIKIEVTNFSTAEDKNGKEKWALDFFKEDLLQDWFTSTLNPGPLAGSGTPAPGTPAPGTPAPGTPAPGTPAPGTPAPGTPAPGTPAPGTPAPGTPAPGTPAPGTPAPGTPPAGGAGASTGTTPEASAMQPANLEILSRNPDPLPAGYGVTRTSTAGTVEAITVLGGNNPVVRVGGAPQTLDANRQFTVDVLPGHEMLIDVEYPATQGTTETFNLLFDFDEPVATGWSVTPPSTAYRRYVNNTPTPAADTEFQNSPAPSGNTSLKGAAAVRDWLQNRVLGSPKQIDIEAYASFEGDSSQTTRNRNLNLSKRRLEAAVGIIQSVTGANTRNVGWHGQQDAETNNRVNRREDRVAKIAGTVAQGHPAATVHAKISRPALSDQPTTTTPPTTATRPTDQAPPAKQGETPGEPAVSLKLKFIRQEELKTLTFQYNSSEAVQRPYAPQGFFGLLLADLEKNKHFIEVDLDDPFFRVFTVTMDAPFDFDKIGLTAAHLTLDYGKPTDPENKHGEFIFDALHQEQKKFEVFMNSRRENFYTCQTQYHFSPDSGWEGQQFAYDMPAQVTEDRTRLINPYEDLGFLEIKVFPNRIDRVVINSTDVQLQYQDSKGWSLKKMMTVTPDSEPQFWKLRLSDPASRSYTYSFVHHLKDGTTKVTQPVTTQATAVAVDDPFEGALDLVFIPALDPARTRKVFVDVSYQDEQNNYKREERLELKSDAVDDVKLRISLVNPKKRLFQYRCTFVGSNGQITRGPLLETTETLLSVTEG